MFEIAMLPAASVLAVQHDLSLDGTMLDVGQSSGGGNYPPPKFSIDIQQGLGQTGAGPLPPPPGKFWIDMEQGLGQTSDGPPAPKPRLMWVDIQQGLGQTDDGPRPPPPGK